MYNLRPPQPKYSKTWDVEIVLRYLRSMELNDKLTLKALSQKLALLFALVEASRSSELQALDLRFRVYKPEGVRFQLPTLTKKRKVGTPPKELFFTAFPSDKKLCPVACLREYEKRTEDKRSSSKKEPRPLFLSYVKPYKPVTSQRVAHWIKEFLDLAGVDTSEFGTHSVRGASTTAALKNGVGLDLIL